ncbi:MAG: serine/threonine protein kinase [Verrucomicrobiae bacterium]|nr:serine/threonine protein kinase [Verrucomicrobiae bacterium]
MRIPTEGHWRRVEELAEQLGALSAEEALVRLEELAAAGEPPSVLTLVGVWHGLPPIQNGLGPGAVVGGGYTLVEKIGNGGMGAVWRATQRTIERDVALKILHPAVVSAQSLERSLDEVRLLGRLRHPGIVRVFDAGYHEDPVRGPLPYFAMELVDGQALDRWAGAVGDDRKRKLEVMVAVCEAVQAAHDRHIVHRDLKPANILVGSDERPVILDFGIARFLGMTSAGDPAHFSGTPHYAAPEQHLGLDTDFRRSQSVDVYALGAVLFEILSGRRLFEFPPGTRLAAVRQAVLTAPMPRLKDVLPDCPEELDLLVARAVRRDPADRFYSVASLGRAMARVSGSYGLPARPVPAWVPAAGAMVPGTEWRLIEPLGDGGTGEVWLGQHERLGQRRVFKFCASEAKVRTLRREYTLYRLLKERIGRHPHFVQLHEVSLDEPPWYLMMEGEDARDLETWCAERPDGLGGVPLRTRIEIVAQAAEALEAAHDAGILHRDIKPGNLLVRDQGAGGSGGAEVHVLIADFGIGQVVLDEIASAEGRPGFTRTLSGISRSELSGTMLYLAPEVLEGGAATARSDIYSLGVVLWQLLVGNLKAALDPADWPMRIEDPLLREDLNRCLAGTPGRRWASAGELAASLRALEARQAGEQRRRAEIAARERAAYRRGVALTAVLASGVVALLAWFGWYAVDRARAASAAESEARINAQSSQLNELARLATSEAPNRIESVRSVLARVEARSDDERRRMADAYVRVLELEDWSIEEGKGLALDGRGLQAVLEGSSRFLLRQVAGGGVDLIDGLDGRRLWRSEVELEQPAVLALAPMAARAAVGWRRQVILLNGSDGTEEARIALGGPPLSLGWNTRGDILAVGLADGWNEGGVELRAAPDWAVSGILAGDDSGVRSRPPTGLAFSPDDRLLAQWSLHSLELLVWELSVGRIAVCAYHPAPVRKAIWTASNRMIAAAADAYLYAWGIEEGGQRAVRVDRPLARYPAKGDSEAGHPRQWELLARFPRDGYLVAADEAGGVYCFDVLTGRPSVAVTRGSRPVALGRRGDDLVIHREDGGVGALRRVPSPVTRAFASQRLGRIEDFDVAPDGILVACAGSGGVTVFDGNRREHAASGTAAMSRGVRFLTPTSLVASSRFGDLGLVWDGGTLNRGALPLSRAFREVDPEEAPARIVLNVGKSRAAMVRRGRIQWAELGGGEVVEMERPGGGGVEDLAMSGDGGRIAWVDEGLRVWGAGWGDRVAAALPGSGRRVAFVGNRWCVVSGGGEVLVVDVIGANPAVRVDGEWGEDSLMELAVQRTGVVAAGALSSGGIVLGHFRVEESPRLRPVVLLGAGAFSRFERLRFAGGDRWLGAIGEDGQLRVWDVGMILRLLGEENCLPSWAGVEYAGMKSGVPLDTETTH